MTPELLVAWLAAGLGGGSVIVLALRVGLPWVRKLVPAVISVGGALEQSRERLTASLQAEITEYQRQLTVCRTALAECEGRKLSGDRS